MQIKTINVVRRSAQKQELLDLGYVVCDTPILSAFPSDKPFWRTP